MAIAFAAVSSIQSWTSFPTSPKNDFTFDCGAGSNNCVILWVWTLGSFANAIGACTYNGAAASSSGTEINWGGTNDHYRMFVFTGAAAGSHSFSVTWTGDPSSVYAQAVSYSGVASASNLTSVTDATGDTTATITVTSTAGDTVVTQFLVGPAGERLTETGTAVERFDADGTSAGIAVYDQAATGASTTITCNSDGTTIFENGFGVSLTPSAGGGASKAFATYQQLIGA